MTLWTWSQILTKVKDDLDLWDEDFVDDTMLLSYANEAIDEAEQHVITINEDYFLQSSNLALTTGTSEYSLPTNIYANKIRRIFYVNGTEKYEIKRVRNLDDILDVSDSEAYKYQPIMNSSGAARIKLFPASRETSSTNVTVWFIGNAKTLSATTDEMNIPEAVHFVIAHMKLRVLQKEGNQAQVQQAQELERQRQLMIDTLTSMVPDDNNQVLADLSFYSEFDPRYMGDDAW